MEMRKSIVSVEEVVTDGGKPLAHPRFTGRRDDSSMTSRRCSTSASRSGRCSRSGSSTVLGSPPVSYGKAAIVGTAGEMEHGGAVCHPKLGKPMREAVGGGEALISSNVKVAAVGASIDVPLGHKDNAWSFDHFDTLTIAVPHAPRPDEIVVVVAVADGGRPHPRAGKGRAVV
jgi:hypothetical protein